MIFSPSDIVHFQELKSQAIDLAHVVTLLAAIGKRGNPDLDEFVCEVNTELADVGFEIYRGSDDVIGIRNR